MAPLALCRCYTPLTLPSPPASGWRGNLCAGQRLQPRTRNIEGVGLELLGDEVEGFVDRIGAEEQLGVPGDRKSVVEGKSVSVRVGLGGRSDIKKKTIKNQSKNFRTMHET